MGGGDMTTLRILLTNHTLADRGGSDLYVRDVATALLERGHRPFVYSPLHGTVAEELRLATIPVVDNLDGLAEVPDLIHGHHHLETMSALLQFPRVPAVYFCHGWLPPQEAPPRFPRILRYVAVDDVCRDRLVCEHGVPENRIEVHLNFVDLRRFARRLPLPARPARALIFSNEAGAHVEPILSACASAGIAVDVLGREHGNASAAPEAVLRQYDVVFAKARSALEAMAVGAAVVLAAPLGLGPMVTAGDFERLRRLNFGIRALRAPLTAEGVLSELRRYDALNAAAVSDCVRGSAGRDEAVDRLMALYTDVLEEFRSGSQGTMGNDDEFRWAAGYLRSLGAQSGLTRARQAAMHDEHARADAAVPRLNELIAVAREEAAAAAADRDAARASLVRSEALCSEATARLDHALATIANMERSRFWKVRLAWTAVRDFVARGGAGRA